MLACLARDLASGATLGWWWQSILRRFPIRLPASWVAVWAEQPLYIPAALEYLERRGQAGMVLERILPVQAWNLLTIVLRAFDLPGLSTTRRPTGERKRDLAAPNQAASPSIEVADSFTPTAVEEAAALRFPWEPFVPRESTPPELAIEKQALLGIGLLLRRVPQVAFTAAFGVRFRAWVEAGESEGRAADADSPVVHVPSGIPPGNDGKPWDRVPERFARPLIPPDAASPAPVELHRSASQPDEQPRESLPAEAVSRVEDRVWPHQDRARDSAPAETLSPTTDRVRPDGEQAAGTLAAAEPSTPSTPARVWEGGKVTRAGGILYLIHFLRQAELMRHFDTGLGGWALVELLGRCLLDDALDLGADPIWAALAHLDGRTAGTPPGSGFEPQRTYAAPASWLGLAGPSRFVRFRSRGMEIWTAEGFLVLDSQDSERPSGPWERLSSSPRRKLRRLARVRPGSLSLSPELRRFLHFVLPYARWRLEGALGRSSLQEALRRTGRLYVTATHVDLVMPMKEISVPVRMAGLDANPGWVPELGRMINFHFTAEGYSHG
jgi:hypothetical protein